MNNPVIVETLSNNNNPWWVAYHESLLTFEVQINPRTKRVLIGSGPIFISSEIMPCSDLLEDKYWLEYIRTNMTKEVMDNVIKECKQVCQ